MNKEIQDKIDTLTGRCTNVVLATITGDGLSLASQSPYALDADGSFLILVSGLAEHGATLQQATQVNILLMEDEAGLNNPFARERLNYDCAVEELPKGSEDREHGEQLLRERFGKFIDTLIALPDFRMVRLSPLDGRYVAGFGAAYTIANGEIQRLGG